MKFPRWMTKLKALIIQHAIRNMDIHFELRDGSEVDPLNIETVVFDFPMFIIVCDLGHEGILDYKFAMKDDVPLLYPELTEIIGNKNLK